MYPIVLENVNFSINIDLPAQMPVKFIKDPSKFSINPNNSTENDCYDK